MRKLSDEKITQIIKTLEKANFAINTLERANKNSMLFKDTKAEIQSLTMELTNRFTTKEFNLEDDE